MIVTQITAAQYLPVPLDDVKLHCRVDGDDDDSLLKAYTGAAVNLCQHRIGRSLMSQGWQVTLDAFPLALKLPYPVVQSIDAITYMDGEGVSQDLDLSSYELVGNELRLASGAVLPDDASMVQIEYTAGYATGDETDQQAAVPDAIKTWILLTVATMYANRESIVVGASVASIQDSFVDRLLDPFKVY